jgi:hypothetical protein
MRAIGISVLALAALGAGECRAVDWEINLESTLQPEMARTGAAPDAYRVDFRRDAPRSYAGQSGDLLRAEAVLRPSAAGAIEWEIGVGASLRPAGRVDDHDVRGRRGNFGDFDGSLTLRATIRPRTSRR